MDLTTQILHGPYTRPLLYILASLLLALVFRGAVLDRLKKMSGKSGWKWDDVVIKGLGRTFIYWFVLGGLYFAVIDAPLTEDERKFAYGLVFVALVVVTAAALGHLSEGLINLYSKKTQGGLPAGSIIIILGKGLIYTLALLVILQTYGISVIPILATLGVGGLAVALALQDTLSNLFAGIQMVASKKIRAGDYVEMEGVSSGHVEDISWRNTTLRTPANNLIIIPNARMSSAIVTNYSRPKEDLSVSAGGSVAYGTDLEKAEKIIAETAQGLVSVDDYKPAVRFSEFGASGINFTVGLKARAYTDQFALRHEFIKALDKRFREEGIEIPFPQMDVHLPKTDL